MLRALHRLRAEDGVEAVEFALVVPILLMLLAGIVNLGVAYNAATLVTTAVRDGARTASLGGTVADICTSMENATLALANEGAANVTIKYGTTTVTSTLAGANCNGSGLPAPGDTATVTMSYANQWLIPIVLTGSTTITRTSQMRVE